MAFMIPVYTKEPFYIGENGYHERIVVPCDAYGAAGDFARDCDVLLDTVEVVTGKWWVRLSAPGYMDCTDWDGPFDTEQQARDHVEEFWEVDADSGDDLAFEEESSEDPTEPDEGDSNG